MSKTSKDSEGAKSTLSNAPTSPQGSMTSGVSKDSGKTAKSTLSEAAASALSSGEWSEKADPKGKVYYINAKTKETTWDLSMTLREKAKVPKPVPKVATAKPAVVPPVEGGGKTPVAPSSRGSTPTSAASDEMARLLKSGEWKEMTDPKGKKYFFNTKTKETTWDLLKTLEAATTATVPARIEVAVQQVADSELLQKVDAVLFSAPPIEEEESDADLDAFINGWLKSKQGTIHNEVERARIQVETEHFHAQQGINLKKQIDALHRQLVVSTTRGEYLEKEVYRLQCSLYYGMGPQMGSFPPPTPPHETAPNPDNPLEKVAYLEHVVGMLQGLNRELYSQLEHERLKKHNCSDCIHCQGKDSWRQLVAGSASPSPHQKGLMILPFGPGSVMLNATTRTGPTLSSPQRASQEPSYPHPTVLRYSTVS